MTAQECLHGLSNCATCAGTDNFTRRAQGPTKSPTPWSAAEDAVARDTTLSSRAAAESVGRTVNEMSAHRLGTLHMKGTWPGYVARTGR